MRLVLIVGGSQGLGLALVQAYTAAGWQVIEFSRSGTGVGHVYLDISQQDLASYTHVLSQLATQPWQEIILINSAASILPIAGVGQMAEGELLAALTCNLVNAIRLIEHFVRLFATHPARKVVAQISSGAALRPIAGWSLYCASKAGLEHYLRVLALEQASQPQPIRVVSIDPGVMDTAMQATIRAADSAQFTELPRFQARYAAGELRAPRQVAAFIFDQLARVQGGERLVMQDEA
ncbi:SDR family NAD(P)-dependent oxidoreductase [Chitinibacter tainanensis]|uniref:SDR family NAD(P)-dependent oxidoreductase n=1 Tax=Chitinibacter tainanensis TaxID=230667 RepID=UPI00041C49B1|nr:SDR family NAD(P)-dependent oxidoreductase [Chitinibacter tainanensis]